DRSTVWVILNLPERALAQAQVGQPVEVSVESLPGETFQGKLTWIGAEVDERSRMARARAEVANPEGRLKARMFAKARILTRQNENALLAPASAIQYVNGQPLVFVQIAEDLFEVRNVRLGARLGQGWEVVDGLQSHDKVVTAHGYSLKSQFLISRLGAGCADD
ncbi:MAG TPA: efflux RND transporter periplasmic adaptor subunit, partial [Clostridia bacterium]|nr:efflux RND transporter periplasmic adaptor subunit [Clostridia bacterium]